MPGSRKRRLPGGSGGGSGGSGPVKRAKADVDELERRLRGRADEYLGSFRGTAEQVRALRIRLDDMCYSAMAMIRKNVEEGGGEGRGVGMEPLDRSLAGSVRTLEETVRSMAEEVLDARKRVPLVVRERLEGEAGEAVQRLAAEVGDAGAAEVKSAMQRVLGAESDAVGVASGEEGGEGAKAARDVKRAASGWKKAAQALQDAGAQVQARAGPAARAAAVAETASETAPAEVEKVLAGKTEPAAQTPAKARKGRRKGRGK